jgi:hypothetical protein
MNTDERVKYDAITYFVSSGQGFDERSAEELWSLLSPAEREGLSECAKAYSEYAKIKQSRFPDLEVPHEVQVWYLHDIHDGVEQPIYGAASRAQVRLHWRQWNEAERQKMLERAKRWYWDEFKKQGGAESYHKPKWLRFFLCLGFSDHRRGFHRRR